MTFIDCEPLQPLLNKECTLHLCIRDFCPKEVTVTWTKDGHRIDSGVFNTPPSLSANGLYSMVTFLKFTPTSDNLSSEFRCRVEHSAQKEPEERTFTLPHLPLTDDWCTSTVEWPVNVVKPGLMMMGPLVKPHLVQSVLSSSHIMGMMSGCFSVWIHNTFTWTASIACSVTFSL